MNCAKSSFPSLIFREASERLATTSFDTSKILRRRVLSFLLFFWLSSSFHRVPLFSDWPLVFEMGRCSPINLDDLLFLCISRPYNNWSKQTKDSLEYHGFHRDNFAHATIGVDSRVLPPCGNAYPLKNASVDYTWQFVSKFLRGERGWRVGVTHVCIRWSRASFLLAPLSHWPLFCNNFLENLLFQGKWCSLHPFDIPRDNFQIIPHFWRLEVYSVVMLLVVCQLSRDVPFFLTVTIDGSKRTNYCGLRVFIANNITA